MSKKGQRKSVLSIPVLEGKVLGVSVYRGFAPLADLARISRADIYDKDLNPSGTQRDLSPKHARDAYSYVTTADPGFWAEVFLCVRNPSVTKFTPRAGTSGYGVLQIDEGAISKRKEISISRVDGNHRLHYADGETAGLPPIEKSVSFCLAFGLSREQEIALFRDINNNQRRMNTSHLDNIEVRLSEVDALKRRDPALYIANRLATESSSPLYNRVYLGGAKSGATSLIPIRTLSSGISYMLSRPSRLTALPDADAQLVVIRNFFEASRHWVPEAWDDPKGYLMLRGAGLWGLCFIGAFVIDLVMSKNAFDYRDMLRVLRSGRKWDWTSKGDFAGLSGRGGAVKISDRVTAELSGEGDLSSAALFKKIMDGAAPSS